jgi:hypothetical protein
MSETVDLLAYVVAFFSTFTLLVLAFIILLNQ